MKQTRTWFWLIMPALLLIIVLFGGGLFFAIAGSLGFFAPVGESAFTLENFGRIAHDREVRAAFIFTLILTSVSTAFSAVGGILIAVWLRRQMQKSVILKTLLQIPLAVPHLAISLILLNLLAPSGIFARIFYAFGLINAPADFPILVTDAYGIGIVLAYILKETPFIALVVLTVLVRVGDEFEQAAQNLGATVWQRFRFVTLPLIAPAVIFSSLIVWVFIFGAFEVPFVLGRSYPTMLAVAANRKFNSTDLTERGEAFALAVLMTLVTTLFVWIYLRFTKNLVEFEKTSVF